MSIRAKFNLKTNPFRLTPATNPDEIIWAGFQEIKSNLENRIKKSIKIPNSSLVLNWGEYGSGKTHAARYFNKHDILNEISKNLGSAEPFSMIMPLPKGKDPVYTIFTNVVDKLNIEDIRTRFKTSGIEIEKIIQSITDNTQIQSVLKAIFDEKVTDISLLKRYLYGNISNTELKELNKFGILRQLDTDSDYTKTLSGLITCLTFDKKVYSTVIIWIDEFEDIAVLNSSNIDKTNNFLREILDNAPNNLLIFLNLTQSALFSVEDLGQYVYESVRSRIKERNSFDLPTREVLIEYIKKLIEYYRTDTKETNPLFPFNEDTVNEVVQVLGNSSLRSYNEAFSLLLELADLEDVCPVTVEFFKTHKDEIVWKNE